jgi:hypothetical protein
MRPRGQDLKISAAFGEEISRDFTCCCLEASALNMNTKSDLVLTFRFSRIGFQQHHHPRQMRLHVGSRPTTWNVFNNSDWRDSRSHRPITAVPIMNLYVDADGRESALTYVPHAARPYDRVPCFPRDMVLRLDSIMRRMTRLIRALFDLRSQYAPEPGRDYATATPDMCVQLPKLDRRPWYLHVSHFILSTLKQSLEAQDSIGEAF